MGDEDELDLEDDETDEELEEDIDEDDQAWNEDEDGEEGEDGWGDREFVSDVSESEDEDGLSDLEDVAVRLVLSLFSSFLIVCTFLTVIFSFPWENSPQTIRKRKKTQTLQARTTSPRPKRQLSASGKLHPRPKSHQERVPRRSPDVCSSSVYKYTSVLMFIFLPF